MKNILKKIPIVNKYIKAKELSQKVLKEFTDKKESVNRAQQEAQDSLELLGRVKIDILRNTLHPFIEQISRIEDIKIIEQRQNTLESEKYKSVIGSDPIDTEKDKTLIATIAAGGAGATTAAVAYAAVGTFASASTGTAITALSGVAASNATLAFLGGGSLAAGGAGVAGGIAVLGGLVTVPLLAVGGYMFNKKVDRDLKHAEEDEIKVKQYIEESDKAISELSKIKNTAKSIHRVVVSLDKYLIPNVALLSQIIDRSSKRNIFIRIYFAIKKIMAASISGMGFNVPDWILTEAKVKVADMSNSDKDIVQDILYKGQLLKNIMDHKIINEEGVVSDDLIMTIRNIEEYLHLTIETA
jgi:hypothetical protein